MARYIFGYIYISKKDKRKLNKHELKFLRYHEQGHGKKWSLERWKDEKYAELYAFKQMLEEGYNLDYCVKISIDLFFWRKFGLRLKDFIKYVMENKNH